MMSEVMARRVSLGSREPTDPMDKFLEQYLLFRKHTVKDGTSLFRVVSEQLYDTQMLHYEIRKECVRFMFRKRRFFEPFVNGDFDKYLTRLERSRGRGSMLELRALCHLYRHNVFLYKPFELGRLYVFNKNYRSKFCIFLDGQDHFDTVFNMTEITTAAICQAIAYKLLYKMLFCLPDVNLAVETMLYPQTFEKGSEKELDNNGNVVRVLCSNGRSFKLDRPEYTGCLLTDYRMCPFHYRTWDKFNRLQGDHLSCVRLVLKDKRVPFPYTVAKAMDPYIYRNVELHWLNIARQEARSLNVYTGDYNFKVGAKCQVDLPTDEVGKMSICHIQAINYDKTLSVVFVENMGKMMTVPYETLHPLPPGQFQPWHRTQNQRRRQLRRASMSRIMRQSVPQDDVPQGPPILNSGGRALPANEIVPPPHQGFKEAWKQFPNQQRLPPIPENVSVPQPNMPPHRILSIPMPQIGCYPGQTPGVMHSRIIHNNQAVLPGAFPHAPFPRHFVIRPTVPLVFYQSSNVGSQPALLPYPYNVAPPLHNAVPANHGILGHPK
ncbi:uncharacterized protein Dana_GF23928, isoform B [Drosophila ananassae]|uniref:Uncharacterized protein, isoform B n=1 Tax=Drosophila ananassae TaxID=7217 RepID=B3MU04_DROAN|nr:protein ovarian tumor locus [Drosophila ananassae]EDV33333.2 uncharacterized protein Dana_GF23928, isoform C [Drosophila ananassae]KPU74392.1 uncharacterized protein Dana_GF23928, isoform B [Drosophila ananassae]